MQTLSPVSHSFISETEKLIPYPAIIAEWLSGGDDVPGSRNNEDDAITH